MNVVEDATPEEKKSWWMCPKCGHHNEVDWTGLYSGKKVTCQKCKYNLTMVTKK